MLTVYITHFEVVGEEYSSFVFLVHEEPHKIRTHVIDPSHRKVWLLENDVRINKSNSIVFFGSELSHLEPGYSEAIDKYVCKDYYYIDMLESLIKTKKYLQTKSANERFVQSVHVACSSPYLLTLDFGTFKEMTGGPVHGGFMEKQVF